MLHMLMSQKPVWQTVVPLYFTWSKDSAPEPGQIIEANMTCALYQIILKENCMYNWVILDLSDLDVKQFSMKYSLHS